MFGFYLYFHVRHADPISLFHQRTRIGMTNVMTTDTHIRHRTIQPFASKHICMDVVVYLRSYDWSVAVIRASDELGAIFGRFGYVAFPE